VAHPAIEAARGVASETDTEAIVHCRDLSIGYEGKSGHTIQVVAGATFSVQPGEAVGIVGESGSGKSTLARALLGYLRGGGRFIGGRLVVDGNEVSSADQGMLAELRGLRVAMVPQNPLSSLTYHVPVGRQVEEVLTTRKGLGKAEAKARTLALFTEMGLPDPAAIAMRYPHQLSGGQRQRVVIAAALACDPNLLVLDEPTTALDKTTEAQVLDLIQRVRAARSTALVLVTHDLNVVAQICERVLVMKDGAIVEQGQVNDVFARPQTAYTRTLLAASLDLTGAAPVPSQPEGLLVEGKAIDFRYRAGGLFNWGKPEPPRTLDGIDLQLGCGEVVGVIGESGSSKTTLGLILAGLLSPEKGVLTLEGQNIALVVAKRNASLRRRVQIVFQDPLSSLNPRQTVATAIMRPLRVFFGFGARQARDKAASLLVDLGLSAEYLERYPRQLSGGQQQRVAIARAFAAEPDVLICDEITSALDASVQSQVLDALDAMCRRRGTSVVLITHDLAVIWRMAGRVMVLKDGKVIEHGATANVFGSPSDGYTRDLLAAASRAARLHHAAPVETETMRTIAHAS